MGSRVAPTTATPDPWCVSTKQGTGRSTVRSHAIGMSAGGQIGQASKQTRKTEQCGTNPPAAMSLANWHSTWTLASYGGYRWQLPIAGEDTLQYP